MKLKHLLLLFVWLVSIQPYAQTITIPTTASINERDKYQLGLLKLALNKAGYQYEIRQSPQVLSQSRIVASLKDRTSDIDLYWMGTSPELEQDLRAIRFPLYQGLLGYRVFIIHKDQQYEFDNVKSLEDLRQKTGIQGVGWSDTKILEAAGLKQKTSQYNSILRMIDSGKRPFYFSRGIHEAFVELNSVKSKHANLIVERNLLISYPFAMFFFTKKNHHELANAIEKGLKAAHKDGSFHAYFEQDPMIKTSLKNANIKNRKWIRINNPYMSEDTKNIDRRYWHKLTH